MSKREVETLSEGSPSSAGHSHKGWRCLFLLPFAALLWPPFYASGTPVLAGFPFFYWYMLVWVVLTGVLSAILYSLGA